jgi:hypothetical protein
MKKVYVIANRGNKAVLMNDRKQYKVAEDKSTTMASLKLLAKFMSGIKDNSDEIVVILPKNLGCLMNSTLANKWLANSNRTTKGVQLTEDYVSIVKYIGDMRRYLGNVTFKLQGSESVTNTEKIYVKLAWQCLENLDHRPEMPACMQA